MEQNPIGRQMMEWNKQAFDNSFSAMSALQDQTEKMVFAYLDKAPWFPEEGKKAIQEWVAGYRKGREDFKAAADESYRKVAEYFSQAEKPSTEKSGKKQKG